jgi:hypothetical protein
MRVDAVACAGDSGAGSVPIGPDNGICTPEKSTQIANPARTTALEGTFDERRGLTAPML